MIGATVAQWSLAQVFVWNDANRLAEWNLLRKTKTLGELSVEQGILAALAPWRDVVGLSNNILLVIAAGVIVFRYSAERWSGASDGPSGRKATLFWGAAWLIAFYRITGYVTDSSGLPPGGCMIVESAVVPALMLLTDGLLLAWALTELRGPTRLDENPLDIGAAITRTSVASLACLLVLPALYAATAAWLASPYVKSLPGFLGRPLRPILSLLLQDWGLVALQAIAPLSLLLISSTPWSQGRFARALRAAFSASFATKEADLSSPSLWRCARRRLVGDFLFLDPFPSHSTLGSRRRRRLRPFLHLADRPRFLVPPRRTRRSLSERRPSQTRADPRNPRTACRSRTSRPRQHVIEWALLTNVTMEGGVTLQRIGVGSFQGEPTPILLIGRIHLAAVPVKTRVE